MRPVSTFTRALMCVVVFSSPAFADDARTEELLLLIGMDQSVSAMSVQISQLIQAQAAQYTNSENDAEVATDYLTRIDSLISERVTWEQFKEPLIESWGKRFTESEIESMIQFFGSPTGNKYVKEIPDLQRESLTIIQSESQTDLVPEIQALVAEMRAQFGPPAAPSPPPQH